MTRAADGLAQDEWRRRMGMVPFTDNVNDLSNFEGYQFEFFCERCGNGYRSAFMRDQKERGKGFLRGASALLGDRFQSLNKLSNAADSVALDRGTNSPAKDKAMREAVEEIRPQFAQCRACSNWVCKDICWNHDIGQCLNCSPKVEDELSRAQAAAQVEQIQQKVRDVDWTSDLDLAERAKVQCNQCGASVQGGKFCPECGGKLTLTKFCSNCGSELNETARFCGECGTAA
jgi:Double zinc ribbon